MNDRGREGHLRFYFPGQVQISVVLYFLGLVIFPLNNHQLSWNKAGETQRRKGLRSYDSFFSLFRPSFSLRFHKGVRGDARHGAVCSPGAERHLKSPTKKRAPQPRYRGHDARESDLSAWLL